MKHMTPIPGLLLAGGLALAPALALGEDQPPGPNPEIAEGAEKLSEGLKLLFRGLLSEGQEGWEDLVDWLDDLSAYEAPERLPNGDIIIRRRMPPPAEGETDL
jgi:hypothetical protein